MFVLLETFCTEDNETCAAWTITISLMLLMFAFIVANIFHAMHLHFIPESCIFMVIGLVFGGIFIAIYSYTELNDFMSLNEPVFILLLLPPIIFDGGYNLKKIYFFRNFGLIMMLAIFGTAFSALLIGGALYVCSNYTSMEPQGISAAEAMSVGSLLSATDPVAALAVYSTLGVDRTLYTLVYGESNLNDAIGIVFYRTFQGLMGESDNVLDENYTPGWDAVLQFAEVTLAAPIIGLFTGLVAALVFKYAKFNEIPIVEGIMFWTFSYLSYMLGEAPGFSGIISTLFCGFIMRHYAYHNLSDKGKDLSIDLIKFLATTADTVIFINLGFSPLAFEGYTIWSFPVIALAIFMCLISRAIVVFTFCLFANQVRKVRSVVEPINFKTQFVLWHAGLRGAVAFVLALEFIQDESPDDVTDYWVATTLAVIFFTVFGLGGTTALLVKFLGIKEEGEKMHNTEVSSAYTEVFTEWDRKWVAPLFVCSGAMDELMVDDGSLNQEDQIKASVIAKLQANESFRSYPSHFHDGYHTEAPVLLRSRINEITATEDLGYQTS